MRQHEILPQIGLRIAGRLPRQLAGDGQRLDRIGVGVAMGGIAIPGLQRQDLAHLVADEIARCFQRRVEALHVPDLQHLARALDRIGELLAFLDRDADRLFAQHVLAGLQRLDRHRHVIGIGGGDDHRLQFRVGQHRVKVAIHFLRLIGRAHACQQIGRGVADRIEVGIARLHAGFQMRELRDRPAAEHTDTKATVLLADHRLRLRSRAWSGGWS